MVNVSMQNGPRKKETESERRVRESERERQGDERKIQLNDATKACEQNVAALNPSPQ